MRAAFLATNRSELIGPHRNAGASIRTTPISQNQFAGMQLKVINGAVFVHEHWVPETRQWPGPQTISELRGPQSFPVRGN